MDAVTDDVFIDDITFQGVDGYSLAARLNVSVPGLDPDAARQIIELAHRTCPYSKAIKGNIDAIVVLA